MDRQTQPEVQAYALTWAAPYRVECMSITAAFAFGFDEALCADGCKPTRRSPYFNSTARLPFTQLRMRPTMSIAARTFEDAKALIDRGVKSDGSHPKGTAYLLSTSDESRNVRSALYPQVDRMLIHDVQARRLTQDELRDAGDVCFISSARTGSRASKHWDSCPVRSPITLTSSGGEMPPTAAR